MKPPPCPKVLRKKAAEIGIFGDNRPLVVNFSETTTERRIKKSGAAI